MALKINNNNYFIAEAGVNHEGSMDKAMLMIEQASEAGASAVKFQAYKAHKIAAKNSPAYWDRSKENTATQFELFKKYDTFGRHEYVELASFCRQKNVDFCCTPFDTDCLEWLVPILPFIKIASADVTNALLLEAVASARKPIVLSVGAATITEIKDALSILEKSGEEIVLLHCVLNYPTPVENAFLHRIKYLQQCFPENEIGYSDHIAPATAGDDQIIIAKTLGVRVFEKHFTFDKSLPGNDHYHAMNAEDLRSLILRLKAVDEMVTIQHSEKSFLEIQSSAIKNARRSLYYDKSLSKGHIIVKKDLISKRPGQGLSPMDYGKIVGKELSVDVSRDDLVKLSDLVTKC